jgi:TRAP transporter TAXI family solute receptor
MSESVTAFKDGTIDAMSAAGGIPMSGFLDVATTANAQFLEMSEEALSKLLKDHPYFTSVQIPAGTYPKQEKAKRTYALQYALMANKDQPDEVIYDFVKTILDHTQELKEVHPSGAYFNPQNPAYKGKVLVPWHPGALKALKEYGSVK